MLNQAFKVLSDIQWRSKKKRRVERYIPCTCRACGDSQAYKSDEMSVCKVCGTMHELVEWRATK